MSWLPKFKFPALIDYYCITYLFSMVVNLINGIGTKNVQPCLEMMIIDYYFNNCCFCFASVVFGFCHTFGLHLICVFK